jgi:hypothetical protein
MVNRVQSLRSNVAGNRPSGRLPGELYVNWPDGQLGVINSASNPQDLIAVRFFSTSASYNIGDFVLNGGSLYQATTAVSPGSFNTAQWVSFLRFSGGTMTGPIILSADPTDPKGAATKEYVDAGDATSLTAVDGAIAVRNRIINGDMSVDQRNNGSAVTSINGYIIDRWRNVASPVGKGAIGQVPNAPVTIGTQYSLSWTTGAAYPPVAADIITIVQNIEGCNFNDALWGTANAKSIVVEFWASSTQTGLYAGAFRNGNGTRSYVFTFTIAAASTWQKFRITIPGDTGGTWAVAANAAAAVLSFAYGVGSTSQTTPNVWTAGNFTSTSGAINITATASASIAFTGVAVMVGTDAVNGARAQFKNYSDNFADCQRYYQQPAMIFLIVSYGPSASVQLYHAYTYPVTMRASPTLTASGVSFVNASTLTFPATDSYGFRASVLSAAAGIAGANWNLTISSEL